VQNSSIRNVLGFLTILFLTSCASTQPQRIEVSSKPVEIPKLVLPKADELNMRNATWTIITEQNFEQVVEDLRKKGKVIVFFALTEDGYENLALNLSDVRAFIQQQKAIIAAYEGYYQESTEALDKANKRIENAIEEVEEQQEVVEEPEPAWKFWK